MSTETNPKDTKTVLYYLGGAILALAVLGYLATGRLPFLNQEESTTDEVRAIDVIVDDQTVSAEVADTDQLRAVGLSEHETLEFGEGMLFVFDQKDITPAFWMKDVDFAIDIIWIDDGKVVQVDEANPEPGVEDANLVLYKPGQPIDYVLEVPKGFSFERKIQIGDAVDLSNL